MTYEQTDQLYAFLITIVIFVIYLLRNTPLGFLWKIVQLFLIVLFATLFANYAKDKIKDWWKS